MDADRSGEPRRQPRSEPAPRRRWRGPGLAADRSVADASAPRALAPRPPHAPL